MAIFKKKEEETVKELDQVKAVIEDSKKIEEPKEEIAKAETKVEAKKVSSGAPVFVKIDKYRDMLDIINDIKTVMFLARNTLSVQKQIELLVDENRRLIEDAIRKMDERIKVLDAELTRPGVSEKAEKEKYVQPEKETEKDKNLEAVVQDLKKQIETLKADLKNIV